MLDGRDLEGPMPIATSEKLLARMTERLREGRHEQATDDFCSLLAGGAQPASLGHDAIEGASPFLNVPAHSMLTPAGELRRVNFDHTILGFWRAYQLARHMPRGYERLPLVQAMWYLPQGLDIWSQVLCEFPGHYAREQEKCPTINLKGPKQHFQEHPPYTEGSFEERLELLVHSIIHGDRVMAFRSFLGLADEASGEAAAGDETKRRALEAQVVYAAIIDMPGPRMDSLHNVNSAHKALRARAMVDLANTFGWEQAYPLFLIVVPDLATDPRFHDIVETASLSLIGAFGPKYQERRHRQTAPLNAREAEELAAVITHGTPAEVVARVTALLEAGKSLTALNDAVILAVARLQAIVEHPSIRQGFVHTAHGFDYTNVVGWWLRNYDHPQQMKAPYLTAVFVNDVARFVRTNVPKTPMDLPSRPEEHAGRAEALSLNETLQELAQACDQQEASYASALVDSYMARTRERKKLTHTLAFENAKFEGDPHLPRNAMSHIEEFGQSSLPGPQRDEIFRSWTRLVSRWHKRSYDYNALGLFESVLLADSGRVRATLPVPDENRYQSSTRPPDAAGSVKAASQA
jgi:hypothetical protein